ncbi:BamA/TamA family outer membrane protein [Saccharicrinis aurantiacus]|uniref:hypothetical protein n=1 Tax=Saccharicrinis aurantiacus TaxID=1849719 RepID=UPI00094F8713|nr:hypothetical protein [Saccharicrinis aurantiacus]
MEIDLTEAKDTLVVTKIFLSGNEKTKAKIIYNELLFHIGDSIVKEDLHNQIIQSKNNLNNTSLFNFVYINYWLTDEEQLYMDIKVDERWYLWALPILEQGDRNLSTFFKTGDWSRINYGLYLKKENFRGMNEIVRFKIRLGFLNEFDLSYESADYNYKLGWGAMLRYRANAQVSYNTLNNVDNVIKVESGFAQQESLVNVLFKYRSNHVNRHSVNIGYNAIHIADTVAKLNPDYLLDGNTSLEFLSLKYSYSIDYRDSKVFPLRGNLLRASALKSGFGIFTSTYNDLALQLEYLQFGNIHKRFYYGWQFGSKYGSSKDNPFVFNKGLGTSEFLNGYEYNVIRGTSYAYSKQKVIFELVPTQTANLKFIPLKQFSKLHYAFYLRTFFDTGYVYDANQDPSNFMSNTFLYSYGLGIDMVTYYDRVLSVNYAINKFGQSGFYIHVNMSL